MTSKERTFDPNICGENGPMTPEQCALWLDAKYRRHGEPEDRAAAMWLRKLSAEHSPVETAAELRDYETVRGAYDQAVAELDKYMTWHANGRSNVEFVDGGVRICLGRHEKYDPCEWAEYKSVVETKAVRGQAVSHATREGSADAGSNPAAQPDRCMVILADVYKSLCDGWSKLNLPAAVISGEQFRQMREALNLPPRFPETADRGGVGNFCTKHPAARYVLRYGCPSCSAHLPAYSSGNGTGEPT